MDYVVNFKAKFEGNNISYGSNNLIMRANSKGKVEIEQKSNITGKYIKAGEEIVYTINVKNPAMLENVATFYDKLPEGLKFVKGSVSQNGKTSSLEVKNDNDIRKSLILKGNETVTISITAKADSMEYNQEIVNEPYIEFEKQNIKANTLTHTILGAKGENPNGGNSGNENDNPNNRYTYSVSGTAWLDENKDGKRDDNEKKLSRIRTYLLNSKDNSIVQTTMTDTNGAYSFANVQVRKLYSSI